MRILTNNLNYQRAYNQSIEEQSLGTKIEDLQKCSDSHLQIETPSSCSTLFNVQNN